MNTQELPRSFISLAAILAMWSPAGVAQGVQAIYSPAILARDSTLPDQRPVQMHTDGSGFARIELLASDVTHNGVAGGRYMVGGKSPPGDPKFQDGTYYSDIVSWHEGGDPATLRVLSSDNTLARGLVQITADGTRVCYLGRRYDATGTVVEKGAFVGEVEWVGGAPYRVFNEHLAATDVPAQRLEVSHAAISWNGLRLVFNMTRVIFDKYGKRVGTEYAGMFLVDTPRAPGGGVASLAAAVPITLTTGEAIRSYPRLSPVPFDNRLLYREQGSGSQYLSVVGVPEGYDGSYALPPTRITSRSNSPAYTFNSVDWSPDGSFVIFVGAGSTDWTAAHIYRLGSNGSGKAVRLTVKADAYANPIWRQ